MVKIGKTIIDSVWWIEYENHDDGTITLISHYRDDNQKGDIASWNEHDKQFTLIETDDRTVTHLLLNGEKLKLRNPKHVFDYPRKEE